MLAGAGHTGHSHSFYWLFRAFEGNRYWRGDGVNFLLGGGASEKTPKGLVFFVVSFDWTGIIRIVGEEQEGVSEGDPMGCVEDFFQPNG
jgi:hypothetical protein